MHVPEGWEINHLSDLAVINPKKPSKPIDGLVSFVPMDAVSETARLERTETKKYEDVEKGFTSFIDGDVLVAKITPCFENGKGALVYNLKNGIGFGSTEFHVLRAKQNSSAEFIYYITTTDEFRIRGEMNMQGSAGQKRVSTDYLKVYKLNTPPFPEQQKIAQILSTWDKAIEKLEALIAAKQKRKKALMQQLLTGKKRFAEFVRSEEKQKTKFGIIPSEWKYIHIGEIAKQISVKNNDSHDLQVLSCTKHHGLVDSLSYFGKQIFSKDTSTYKIVPRNSFAYATNHIEEGSIGYQNICDEALISPMYTVFQTERGINDNFLYRLLKTELYRHIFEINTSASVDRRGSLRWNQFANIKIPVPELAEQQKIVSVLSAADKEIETHQNQLSALKEQKKGLMQQILTGKKRVKTEGVA